MAKGMDRGEAAIIVPSPKKPLSTDAKTSRWISLLWKAQPGRVPKKRAKGTKGADDEPTDSTHGFAGHFPLLVSMDVCELILDCQRSFRQPMRQSLESATIR